MSKKIKVPRFEKSYGQFELKRLLSTPDIMGERLLKYGRWWGHYPHCPLPSPRQKIVCLWGKTIHHQQPPIPKSAYLQIGSCGQHCGREVPKIRCRWRHFNIFFNIVNRIMNKNLLFIQFFQHVCPDRFVLDSILIWHNLILISFSNTVGILALGYLGIYCIYHTDRSRLGYLFQNSENSEISMLLWNFSICCNFITVS